PYGQLPHKLLLQFARSGRPIAFWSYDSNDYQRLPAATLLRQIRANPPRSGDVVLMHDDNQDTVAVLAGLLSDWRAQGYAVRALPGDRACGSCITTAPRAGTSKACTSAASSAPCGISAMRFGWLRS